MTEILILLFAAAAIVYFANARRVEVQNARTLVYARFVGVYPVFPLTPFDESVQARADALRECFAAHGNNDVEVVEYVFGLPINNAPTVSIQYAQFLAEAARDYLRRCDEYAAKKAKQNAKGAAVHVGGQTVTLEVLNKEYLKP